MEKKIHLRRFILILSIFAVIVGCGGSGESVPAGPPLLTTLNTTVISGSSPVLDWTPDRLIKTERIVGFKTPNQLISVTQLYECVDPLYFERVQMSFPALENWTPGSVFTLTGDLSNDPASFLIYTEDYDLTDFFEQWAYFTGTVTVTSVVGSVYTLSIDVASTDNSAKSPFQGSQIRIQGTFVLDVDRQPIIEPPV